MRGLEHRLLQPRALLVLFATCTSVVAQQCPGSFRFGPDVAVWNVQGQENPWYDEFHVKIDYPKWSWNEGLRRNVSTSNARFHIFEVDAEKDAAEQGTLQLGYSGRDAVEFVLRAAAVHSPFYRIDGYFTEAEISLEHRRADTKRLRTEVEGPHQEAEVVTLVLPVIHSKHAKTASDMPIVCFLQALVNGRPEQDCASGTAALDIDTLVQTSKMHAVPDARIHPFAEIICYNPFARLWPFRYAANFFCGTRGFNVLLLSGQGPCNRSLTIVSQVPIELPWLPSLPIPQGEIFEIKPLTANLKKGKFPPNHHTAEEARIRSRRYGTAIIVLLAAGIIGTFVGARYAHNGYAYARRAWFRPPRDDSDESSSESADDEEQLGLNPDPRSFEDTKQLERWSWIAAALQLTYYLFALIIFSVPSSLKTSCYSGLGWEAHICAVIFFVVVRACDVYAYMKIITKKMHEPFSTCKEILRFAFFVNYFFCLWWQAACMKIARHCDSPPWIVMAFAFFIKGVAWPCWLLKGYFADNSRRLLFARAHMHLVASNLTGGPEGEADRIRFYRLSYNARIADDLFQALLLTSVLYSVSGHVQPFSIARVAILLDAFYAMYEGSDLLRVLSHFRVSAKLTRLEEDMRLLTRSRMANEEHNERARAVRLGIDLDDLAVEGLDEHPQMLTAQSMIAGSLRAQQATAVDLACAICDTTMRKCMEILVSDPGGGTIIVVACPSVVSDLKVDPLDGGNLLKLFQNEAPAIDSPKFRLLLSSFAQHSETDRWTSELLAKLSKDLKLSGQSEDIAKSLIKQPMDGAIVMDSDGVVQHAAVQLNHRQRRYRFEKTDGTCAGTRHHGALAVGCWLSNRFATTVDKANGATNSLSMSSLREKGVASLSLKALLEAPPTMSVEDRQACGVFVRSDAGGIHILVLQEHPLPPRLLYWNPQTDGKKLPWEPTLKAKNYL